MERFEVHVEETVEVFPIPFDVGYAAYFTGEDCPYPQGTIQSIEWNNGFHKAWAEEVIQLDDITTTEDIFTYDDIENDY